MYKAKNAGMGCDECRIFKTHGDLRLTTYDFRLNSNNQSFHIPLRTSKKIMFKYKLGLIVIVALLVSSKNTIAQEGITGHETQKATVNFADLAKYYQVHPLPRTRKMPFNESEAEEEKPKHRPAHGESVHTIDMTAVHGAETPHSAYLPASPAPVDTFVTSTSPGDIIPPDTHGAVDSQFCVTAVNTEIRIQTRGGANLYNININAFWASVLPSTTEAFDPRVFYDQYNKRWILITDAVNGTSMTKSTVMMAVTATSDPTGVWRMYTINVDSTGASWMDFPNVGYNNKWVVVTGNMFANTMSGINGAVAYVVDYAAMRAGTGAPYTRFFQGSSFSICPAQTYDTTEPNLYAIETWNGSTGQLKLWEFSGPVASPVMNAVGYPATTTTWRSDPPGGFNGDFAPQAGTANLINIGDDRITSVTYRNHKLWCSHTVFLPHSGPTRSSIMWWQLDTNATPIQNGLIDDATSGTFYAYSSIAVNANDDALIGMGIFSATSYASGGYALHLSTDALNSNRTPVIFTHGLASYYETFGGGRNRWGDYSATCIDPRNDTDFWTIQESSYVGLAPNWYTWWASVQFCPKPASPVLSAASPSALCLGDSAEYYVDPIPGATSYEWIVAGTGWTSGGSVTDSIHLLAGVGVATVTVLAYNACGEGEPLTLFLTPGKAPSAAPTITTLTPACIDSPVAVFLATDPTAYPGISAYYWQTIGSGWSGTGNASTFTDTIGPGPDTIVCVVSNTCGISPYDTFVVTPAVIPTSTFTISNHVTEIVTGDVLTFTGIAPTGSTFTWNFGTGYISAVPGTGAGPQTVMYGSAALETLSLTVDNAGCLSSTYTDTILVIDTASAAVKILANAGVGIHIIPNPSDGVFDIAFDKPISSPFAIKIIDMQGRLVFNNKYGAMTGNKISVDAGMLPSGTYTVSVFINDVPMTTKITINR